jgi:signal transduction histidine kinase
LDDVISDLELAAVKAGAQLDVGPLPEVEADKLQMYQLFKNLLSNAIKYRRPDAAPNITVRSHIVDGGAAEVTVTDNGIGFDEKYLERIFKPFERLHAANRYEGSGIGLAVCQKIAYRHEWDLTAHSKLGAGATFVLRIKAGSILRLPGEEKPSIIEFSPELHHSARKKSDSASA